MSHIVDKWVLLRFRRDHTWLNRANIEPCSVTILLNNTESILPSRGGYPTIVENARGP